MCLCQWWRLNASVEKWTFRLLQEGCFRTRKFAAKLNEGKPPHTSPSFKFSRTTKSLSNSFQQHKAATLCQIFSPLWPVCQQHFAPNTRKVEAGRARTIQNIPSATPRLRWERQSTSSSNNTKCKKKKKCAKSMSKTVSTNSSLPKFTKCSINHLDKNFEQQLCK